MIKTYLKVQFDSNGSPPSEIIKRLKGIGCSPIIGDYDFEKILQPGESLFTALDSMHDALKGTGAKFSVTTRTLPDSEEPREPAPAEPPISRKEKTVLSAMAPSGSSIAALSRALSLPRDEVKKVLDELVSRGLVTGKKKGKYMVYFRKQD